MSEPEKVHATIVKVMRDVDAIGKNRNNEMQKYKFRGVDDVYNELHESMAKHGLFTVPRVVKESSEERQTKSGGLSIYRILHIEFVFFNEHGDSVVVGPIVGEGMDSGDKASNKAHSVAHKYALLQVFMIPTEDPKDPENDSPKVVSKPQQKPAQEPPSHPAQSAPQKASFVKSSELIAPEGKKSFYKVTFQSGNTATTFSQTTGEIADRAARENLPVFVRVTKNGNFTNLESLEIAQ